jgi:methyl halide transferase
MELNANYWDLRYQNNKTPWDIGYANPILLEMLCQYDLEGKKILIPGAGNAYEAIWLVENTKAIVTVIDISETVINKLKKAYSSKGINLICGDFFDYHGSYDFILEQTFFCALPREMRKVYVEHIFELLKPGGILLGLLFIVEFEKEEPPFGGSISEYLSVFGKFFKNLEIIATDKSIKPRVGKEATLKASKILIKF